MAAKINVPLILGGFLCHSVKAPRLLPLVCPSLDGCGGQQQGSAAGSWKLPLQLPHCRALRLVLWCPRDPLTCFDSSGFVAGSSGGTCLWDIVEASENFLGILAHYSFLWGFLSWALFQNSLELPFRGHCSPVLLHFLLTYKHKATSLKQTEHKTFLILLVTFFSFP